MHLDNIRQPNRKTKLKERILTDLGYKVIGIDALQVLHKKLSGREGVESMIKGKMSMFTGITSDKKAPSLFAKK